MLIEQNPMHLQRQPVPALRPYIATIWATEGDTGDGVAAPAPFAQPRREHVLPTGAMHLVFRLCDSPLWLLDADDGRRVQRLGQAIVGGTRSRYCVREMSAPSFSVGVALRPGASTLLFGAPADELAERHTPLEDLWDAAARTTHQRLIEARGAAQRMALLEAMLLARLPPVHGMHPAIAEALAQAHLLDSVGEAVKRSGFSHRHFVSLFRHAVGLAPKAYQRVLRFQRALRGAHGGGGGDFASVAIDAGYSDQAHFNREFVEFTGVTPSAYRRAAPAEANHLPTSK